MSLFSRTRRHIDMGRVKEMREEKIKEETIADIQEQQEEILAELKKIEIKESPKYSNWRREISEQMTTADMGMVNLNATEDALENVDISDNTAESINSSVSNGGGGTGYNTGLNMGAEMISISGSSDSKSFTLGAFDTSKATTVTFKSLQGDYNNGGMANTEDTEIYFEDGYGNFYFVETISSNYVNYVLNSDQNDPDYPFKPGLFDTMTSSQEQELRDDYSAWIALGAEHGFSSSIAKDAQFTMYAKIVRYLGDQQSIRSHTYTIPPSARGTGKILIIQGSNSGSSWTNDMGFSNFEVKRTTPISVLVSLDDPQANSFIRMGDMNNLSAEERKKKLQDMLEAGNELMRKLGLDPSKTTPGDMEIAAGGGRNPATGGSGGYGSDNTNVPSQAERDLKNMKWDPHMKMWAPNIPRVQKKGDMQVAHYKPDGEVIVEKKRLKSVKDIPGYYDGKPSPLGFPIEEPPKTVNGYHPDLVDGKKVAQRFNRLDPISARSMPPTGNPHIDKKVRAAAKKPK